MGGKRVADNAFLKVVYFFVVAKNDSLRRPKAHWRILKSKSVEFFGILLATFYIFLTQFFFLSYHFSKNKINLFLNFITKATGLPTLVLLNQTVIFWSIRQKTAIPILLTCYAWNQLGPLEVRHDVCNQD